MVLKIQHLTLLRAILSEHCQCIINKNDFMALYCSRIHMANKRSHLAEFYKIEKKKINQFMIIILDFSIKIGT